MEVWQILILNPDGTEQVVGVHLSEEAAERQRRSVEQDGVQVVLETVEMGNCGCGG